MEPGYQRTSAFEGMHTTVPFAWRRYLGLFRILFGAAAAVLYVAEPVRSSLFVTPLFIVYTLWNAYTALSGFNWIYEHPELQLVFDVLAFLFCATHPSETGSWFALVGYYYLLVLTALLYDWKVVGSVAAAASVLYLVGRPQPAWRMWPAILPGGVLAIIMAVQRKMTEQRLSAALKRSVLSRSEAELAREQERQRIAADFHDGPLQSFISFQMRLEIIRKLMARNADAALKELLQLQELGRAQVTELRAFVRLMQPAEVTPMTLASAIRETVEHFERDSGITTELLCDDLTGLDESMTGDVLQIVRETLNNARKHSKASRVTMHIRTEPGGLELEVEDDGSGFPFSGAYSLDELEILRLGPRSIKRRVRTLGGDLTLDSRPTRGANLSIRLPITR